VSLPAAAQFSARRSLCHTPVVTSNFTLPEDDLETRDAFARAFAALTGHPPLPWQEALYLRFLDGDFPDVASPAVWSRAGCSPSPSSRSAP
jgi:hypothetical protein